MNRDMHDDFPSETLQSNQPDGLARAIERLNIKNDIMSSAYQNFPALSAP